MHADEYSPIRYTAPVKAWLWDPLQEPRRQLQGLGPWLAEPGIVVLRFQQEAVGAPLPWPELEAWVAGRAVSVADIGADLAGAALELALCCDLVYLRRGVVLRLPGPAEAPSAGVVWASGRAGRGALRHALLTGGSMDGDTAVALGLAAAVVAGEAPLPLPQHASVQAMTAVRDVERSVATDASGALELASFRLLFASGHPREGATAFLEGRDPDFLDPGD